jgi:hypothetical protein
MCRLDDSRALVGKVDREARAAVGELNAHEHPRDQSSSIL